MKATPLQPSLRKDEERKPKPRPTMTVMSWKTAQGDVEKEEEKQTGWKVG